jgi:hypothetical protein
LTPIEKYWVVCRSLAVASSKVFAKLVPSIGFCCTPLTCVGCVTPMTS